jgi:Na+-transporting NADH:ubiquinone oxidoreductase subunit C
MKFTARVWYPILYMFILTLFLSTIIIFFGSFTGQRVKDNERIAFEHAVLEALNIDMPPRSGPSDIHQLYQKNIKEATIVSAGALRYMKGDSLIGYALPLEGPGFWARIKGVIGIAADQQTITGISFYEQNETPGLGGEIVKPQFRDQFIGKRLADKEPLLEIRLSSSAVDESSVHAITGATQTSTRLDRFMNMELAAWQRSMKEATR